MHFMTESKRSTVDKQSLYERMSDSESCSGVNPLYSSTLSTSMSDHSSLGRQRTTAAPEQSTAESGRVLRSATAQVSEESASQQQQRSGDVSRNNVPSSGSLPSMSVLHISRPPQTSTVEEEQHAAAATKLQPPAVPVRLIRAPSASTPDSNLPRINCPEKIVICLDISKEMEKKSFILRQGDKKSPIELIIQAVNIFMQTKRALDSRHEFALMFLHNTAQWMCDFTPSPSRIMTILHEMKNCVESERCDLSSIFDEIAVHILPPEVPHPLDVPPPYVVRVILIYGRSLGEPTIEVTKHRRALQASDYFCLDVFYLHDPVSDDNQCESIFEQLCSLDVKGTAYILEASKNPTKVFDGTAQLLSHPLQRPLQQHANYSILTNGAQTNAETRS